jgi:hypothetical protein
MSNTNRITDRLIPQRVIECWKKATW